MLNYHKSMEIIDNQLSQVLLYIFANIILI